MASFHLLFCLLVVGDFGYSIASSEVVDEVDRSYCRRDSLVVAFGSAIRRCINMTSPTFPGFSSNLQRSECRTYTEAFCKSLPTVRQCLDEEGNRWSDCFTDDDKFDQVNTLFKDTVKATLDDLCQDNGEMLSRFLHSLNTNTLDYRARNAFVRECLISLAHRTKIVDTSKASFPTKYWYVHKEIGKFKSCITEHLQADNETVQEAVQYINRTLETMKCPHPENESEVLCKDLDNVIDRGELCPFKIPESIRAKVPMSLIVEARTSSCFDTYEPQRNLLKEARSLEDFEEYFRKYCRRQDWVKNCISETSHAAEICLSEDAYDIFKLVRNYLELVLEGGCYQQGRRLATMMHTAYLIRENILQRNAVLDCLDQAKEGRNVTMDGPARIYAYYQEFSIIKNCLLEKFEATDAEDFRKDAAEWSNLIDERMMCFHPEDRTAVLCKTIESK